MQRPAILPNLLDFWRVNSEWRPSFRWSRGSLGIAPRDRHLARHRPVAGLLLDVIAKAARGFRYKKRAQTDLAARVIFA
jgi:hypothetical protein